MFRLNNVTKYPLFSLTWKVNIFFVKSMKALFSSFKYNNIIILPDLCGFFHLISIFYNYGYTHDNGNVFYYFNTIFISLFWYINYFPMFSNLICLYIFKSFIHYNITSLVNLWFSSFKCLFSFLIVYFIKFTSSFNWTLKSLNCLMNLLESLRSNNSLFELVLNSFCFA